jgi:uncharacterized protein YceK
MRLPIARIKAKAMSTMTHLYMTLLNSSDTGWGMKNWTIINIPITKHMVSGILLFIAPSGMGLD